MKNPHHQRRGAKPAWLTHRVAAGLLWALAAAGAFTTAPIAAQDLTLVVRVIQSETRQPVVSATIEQRAADSTALARAVTDARGIAELPVSGEPPYSLNVQGFGYQEREHVVDDVGAPADGRWLIQIEVERAAIAIEGITAEAEALELHYGWLTFRASGMVYDRAPDFCMFLALDGRIIRDPREMLSVIRGFYEYRGPSPAHPHGQMRDRSEMPVRWSYYQNDNVPEPVREAVWPCGLSAYWTSEPPENPWGRRP